MARAELPSGTTIRRFVVLECIGEGASGVVYSAYDYSLDRKIAIKLVGGPGALEQAQALAKVSHRNVVAVHAVGTFRDDVFIAMEHVEGVTLRAWLEPGRDLGEIIAAALDVGHGLAAAHASQLVHGDVTPDHVLVERGGRCVVVGFAGDARAMSRDYMAPEVGDGPPTPASDQFSFCVLLREALHGDRSRVRVPARVRAALARGLREAPEARWPSMAALCEALAPSHRRTRGLVLAGAVAAAAGAGVAAASLAAPEHAPVCGGGDERVAAMWTPARREALRVRLTPATFERAVQRVDEYTRGWTAMFGAACRATHVAESQSTVELDLRMECLRRRLVELGATLDALAAIEPGAPLVDARAMDALAAVSSIAPCEDVGALQAAWPLPADPVGRQRVTSLSDDFARAKALHDTGSYFDARAALQRVAEGIAAVGYRPLEAEALGLLGRVQFETESVDDAEHTLTRAIAAASAGDMRDVAALAWLDLAWIAGKLRGQRALSDERATLARGVIELAGNPPRLTSDLDDRLGILAIERGDLPAARTHLLRALDVLEKEVGAKDPKVGVVLQHVAILQRAEGDVEAGFATTQRALAIIESTLGPDHPAAAQVLNDLAFSLVRRQRVDEALAAWRRSLAILERAHGAHSPEAATVRSSLALGLRDRGELDEALRQAKRALDDVGDGAPNAGQFMSNYAYMLMAAKRFPEAEREMLRAIAAHERHGAGALVEAYRGLGKVRVAAGNHRGAIEPFEEVLKIRERGKSRDLLALARIALAEALANSGVDRKRARLLAAEAKSGTSLPELTARATAILEGR